MSPEDREKLNREWQENEAELSRLYDLAAGPVDPVTRAAQLEQRQDEIEYLIGADDLDRRRSERDGRPESPSES